MLTQAVIRLITLYQQTLSPDHGPLAPLFGGGACRFEPTCSEYAKTALQKYGCWRGTLLSLRRISRCHPYTLGGYDPVPSRQRVSGLSLNDNEPTI